MGNIMAVVAVFEIHMDRNIVVNMKPSISLAELVPTYTVHITKDWRIRDGN